MDAWTSQAKNQGWVFTRRAKPPVCITYMYTHELYSIVKNVGWCLGGYRCLLGTAYANTEYQFSDLVIPAPIGNSSNNALYWNLADSPSSIWTFFVSKPGFELFLEGNRSDSASSLLETYVGSHRTLWLTTSKARRLQVTTMKGKAKVAQYLGLANSMPEVHAQAQHAGS